MIVVVCADASGTVARIAIAAADARRREFILNLLT
jgi:hypothetical protein